MAYLNDTHILREPKKGKAGYTPISNDILQSSTLTSSEKSILVHFLSLPKSFVILKKDIWKKMNIGRDAFNKAWKGLEKHGYVKSERKMDNKGQFKGWIHYISETPKFRISENPNIGFSVNIEKKECIKEVVKKRSIQEKNTSIPGSSYSTPDESLYEKFDKGELSLEQLSEIAKSL
jgi:DNA-binding MarR family transcriptional regulator